MISSSSQTIRSDVIAELGELHLGRKTVQPASRQIAEFYAEARSVLKHELLQFTDVEIGCLSASRSEM